MSFVSVYDRSQYFLKKYLTNTNVRPCLKLNTFTFIDEQRHGGKKNGRSLSRLGGDAQASAIREQGALRRPRVHETKQNGFDRFLFFFFLFFYRRYHSQVYLLHLRLGVVEQLFQSLDQGRAAAQILQRRVTPASKSVRVHSRAVKRMILWIDFLFVTFG